MKKILSNQWTMNSIGYGNIASSYNKLYEEEQFEKIKLIKAKFSVKKTDLLLDLGCGTGIASKNFDCTKIRIDPSIEMLKESRKLQTSNFKLPTSDFRLPTSDFRLQTVCGFAEHLPFKDNCFDCAISLTAIHNFNDYSLAIKELKRVVKGTKVISILKRAKNFKKIYKLLDDKFEILDEINSSKDLILLLK